MLFCFKKQNVTSHCISSFSLCKNVHNFTDEMVMQGKEKYRVFLCEPQVIEIDIAGKGHCAVGQSKA